MTNQHPLCLRIVKKSLQQQTKSEKERGPERLSRINIQGSKLAFERHLSNAN